MKKIELRNEIVRKSNKAYVGRIDDKDNAINAFAVARPLLAELVLPTCERDLTMKKIVRRYQHKLCVPLNVA
jgi:hypothetical protein